MSVLAFDKVSYFRMINGLLPQEGYDPYKWNACHRSWKLLRLHALEGYTLPRRSVGNNLALPLEMQRKLSKKERQERVEAALTDVVLDGCTDKYPDELSGGMRRRAAFARAIPADSNLLLLD